MEVTMDFIFLDKLLIPQNSEQRVLQFSASDTRARIPCIAMASYIMTLWDDCKYCFQP